MTGDEIRRVKTHFDRLDDEFTRGLRERVGSKTPVEPYSRPPSSVGFVVLEFSREEYRDEDLEYTSLNTDDGDNGETGVCSVPLFEEPFEFEKGDHTDHSAKVGEGSHGGTELVGVRVELWSGACLLAQEMTDS